MGDVPWIRDTNTVHGRQRVGSALVIGSARNDRCSLAWTFHTFVAADGSRRHIGCEQSAPTAVGGYALLVNRAEYNIRF